MIAEGSGGKAALTDLATRKPNFLGENYTGKREPMATLKWGICSDIRTGLFFGGEF